MRFINDENVVENIKALVTSTAFAMVNRRGCLWNAKFELPLSPSPLQKEDGIEWYLIYFSSGYIGLRYYSDINESHYLLAKLVGGTTYFDSEEGCKIEIE